MTDPKKLKALENRSFLWLAGWYVLIFTAYPFAIKYNAPSPARVIVVMLLAIGGIQARLIWVSRQSKKD